MLHKLPFLKQMQLNYPFVCHNEEVNQFHVTSQLHFNTIKSHPFMGRKRKSETQKKREKIFTRWSAQDYLLNMASQSLWASNGNTVVSKKTGNKHIQLCVKQASLLGVSMFSMSMYVCVQMCVCKHAIREGLLKSVWFVFWPSCIETHSTTHTCLELYSHICAVAQISPLPPQKHLL